MPTSLLPSVSKGESVRKYGLYLLLVSLLCFFPVGGEAAEILRYAGATTLKNDFMPEAGRLFQKQTGVVLHVSGGNTDPGLRALKSGSVDIAGSGRFLTDSEKNEGLVEFLIGWDVVQVLVHESNPLENLSLKQLQDIFSGKVSNWKDVGGLDAPIMVVSSPVGSGMRALVSTKVLGGEPYTGREVVSSVVADADEQVARFPVALTALSKSMVDTPGVKTLGVDGVIPDAESVRLRKYPLVKPLLLVTRGIPSGRIKEFIDFAAGVEGQRIVEKKFYRAH